MFIIISCNHFLPIGERLVGHRKLTKSTRPRPEISWNLSSLGSSENCKTHKALSQGSASSNNCWGKDSFCEAISMLCRQPGWALGTHGLCSDGLFTDAAAFMPPILLWESPHRALCKQSRWSHWFIRLDLSFLCLLTVPQAAWIDACSCIHRKIIQTCHFDYFVFSPFPPISCEEGNTDISFLFVTWKLSSSMVKSLVPIYISHLVIHLETVEKDVLFCLFL